jgi:hypothetical protein
MYRLQSSSGFLNLSTVCSAIDCPGLFHPSATSRVRTRTRRSLSAQRPPLIGKRCLLAGSDTVRSPTCAGCRGSTCQLRGFVPRGAAFLPVRGLDTPAVAAFLGFCSATSPPNLLPGPSNYSPCQAFRRTNSLVDGCPLSRTSFDRTLASALLFSASINVFTSSIVTDTGPLLPAFVDKHESPSKL